MMRNIQRLPQNQRAGVSKSKEVGRDPPGRNGAPAKTEEQAETSQTEECCGGKHILRQKKEPCRRSGAEGKARSFGRHGPGLEEPL